MAYSGINVPPASGCGVLAWVKRNMARSNKSFSELQRQSIGVELARREANGRKPAINDWQSVLDDAATAPPAPKVLPADH
jgi:hypothetical protein